MNLNTFNKKNILDMSCMVQDCNNLKQINFSHFDTSKVQNMLRMFQECKLVTSLDVSNYTKDMSKMQKCSNIVVL